MVDRFPVTVMPVLVGFVPGVTVTVKSVVPPATTEFGLAAPTPEGFVPPPPPQGAAVVAVLRGVGATAVKSVELLSVSVQPFPPRLSAVVVEGAGATAVSKQLAVAP